MKYLFIISLSLLCSTGISQNWNEIVKVTASDRNQDDYYGCKVSISGDRAIVGAYNEDEDTSGGATMTTAGAAYILERDNLGNWVEVQKLVASDRAANDFFGISVSINEDYAIVGATGEDEDEFGGTPVFNSGSAYLFERNLMGVWEEVQKIVSIDRAYEGYFGSSVSISGGYAAIGALREDDDENNAATMFDAGAAHIFERNLSGIWMPTQKIVHSDRAAGDEFGYRVCINNNDLIVSAWYEDEDVSGGSTMSKAGSAYVFERDGGGVWSEVQKLVPSDRGINDQFGQSLSLNGEYMIISSPNESEDENAMTTVINAGSAYIFERNGSGVWVEIEKIVASDRAVADFFGMSVSISGDRAIIGAYFEDEDTLGAATLSNAGSAYVFERNTSGDWLEIQKIVPLDRGLSDRFGNSVGISNDQIIVAAIFEDEDDQGLNTMSSAGAVYIFNNCATNAQVSQSGLELTANFSGATYQWIDCNNNNDPIPGETNQTFTVAANGSYAVVINNGSCSDTSNCFTVSGIGFIEYETSSIQLYPNPVENTLNIQSESIIEEFSIVDVNERIVLSEKINSKIISNLNLSFLETGIYFVKILNVNGITTIKKLLKN